MCECAAMRLSPWRSFESETVVMGCYACQTLETSKHFRWCTYRRHVDGLARFDAVERDWRFAGDSPLSDTFSLLRS